MKKLFIAESENHVRNAIRLVLEEYPDLTIIGEAEHTESFLAQVCQNPPDIILMDWNLPGINHQRLIKTIRQHCSASRLFAMSVKPEDERNAQDYQVDGFLSKQYDPDIFIHSLLEMVQKQST